MDILKKLDKIQEKLDEKQEEREEVVIITGVYPGRYESMDDNHLMYYYESAKASYEESQKALKEIGEELKRRDLLD